VIGAYGVVASSCSTISILGFYLEADKFLSKDELTNYCVLFEGAYTVLGLFFLNLSSV